jgi:hypothetical protein
MLRRWHILLMIAVVLLATCLLAAAKLRATPKYDRVQVGMTLEEIEEILDSPHRETSKVSFEADARGSTLLRTSTLISAEWLTDEGVVLVHFAEEAACSKTITRRGPLERLAWLAGWR